MLCSQGDQFFLSGIGERPRILLSRAQRPLTTGKWCNRNSNQACLIANFSSWPFCYSASWKHARLLLVFTAHLHGVPHLHGRYRRSTISCSHNQGQGRQESLRFKEEDTKS